MEPLKNLMKKDEHDQIENMILNNQEYLKKYSVFEKELNNIHPKIEAEQLKIEEQK